MFYVLPTAVGALTEPFLTSSPHHPNPGKEGVCPCRKVVTVQTRNGVSQLETGSPDSFSAASLRLGQGSASGEGLCYLSAKPTCPVGNCPA